MMLPAVLMVMMMMLIYDTIYSILPLRGGQQALQVYHPIDKAPERSNYNLEVDDDDGDSASAG